MSLSSTSSTGLRYHESLFSLASQLQHDRDLYLKVIAMSERLQARIEALQQSRRKKEEQRSSDIERYYRLLEQSNNLRKELDRLSMEYDGRHDSGLSLGPITPPASPPPASTVPIIHFQKRINGIRGFLTRTYQLSQGLVMSKTQVTPLRLFTATEVMTGQPKAVLKVTMTAPLNDYDRHQFGFSFFWHGRPKKRNRAYDVAKFALEPDAKVKAALDSWIYQQNIFPPLYKATHILRESIKIYVVYDRHLL